jgi:DNA repair protein RecO (recombination protein O)
MSEKPHILRTPAVVLRSIDYGETSRIVTLFTQEKGRMSVMAKGARSGRSRFGSTLEPLSHMEAVIFCRSGRDLQMLTETSHIDVWRGLSGSLEKLETGYKVLEMTNALMHQEEANPVVYSLLVTALTALDATDARAGNLWPWFQLRLAGLLGFGPAFDGDTVKQMETEYGMLDLSSGVIAAHGQVELQAGRRATRRALRAFAVLSRAALRDAMNMQMDPITASEVTSLVAAYITWHVESAYPTRTARVFAQLAN